MLVLVILFAIKLLAQVNIFKIQHNSDNRTGGYSNNPWESNNKSSKFLKRFKSSMVSLSAAPSLKSTYPIIWNSKLSSRSDNALLNEKASSSMKISPYVRPAEQHCSFQNLTSFSMSSLLNNFSCCKARSFRVSGSKTEYILFSFREVSSSSWCWVFFNISKINFIWGNF